MTSEARAIIRAAYLNGETVEDIARMSGVTSAETETYLRWWCDRGCPEVLS